MDFNIGDRIYSRNADEAAKMDKALVESGYITDFEFENGIELVIIGKYKERMTAKVISHEDEDCKFSKCECGKYVELNDKYCSECGKRLVW